jgi:hypothetical protein
MKRTIKIKLGFDPETGQQARVKKLINLAKGVHRATDIDILDVQHFEQMSYIIFVNPFSQEKK